MAKRKKYNPQKQQQELLIGAQFGWQCRDPLEPKSDITHTWLGHKNPVKRVLIRQNRSNFYGLTDKLKLKWRVNVEVEFKDMNGKAYYRGADLVIHGILREADGHYQAAIEEIFNEANMQHYVTCHMTAEVIGTNAITDRDFEEVA